MKGLPCRLGALIEEFLKSGQEMLDEGDDSGAAAAIAAGERLKEVVSEWFTEMHAAQGKAVPERLEWTDPKIYLQLAADAVRHELPPHRCFLILAFTPTPEGSIVEYVSNASRKDNIDALKEWLFRQGEAANWMKDIR